VLKNHIYEEAKQALVTAGGGSIVSGLQTETPASRIVGFILAGAQRDPAATQLLVRAIELDPEVGEAWFLLAQSMAPTETILIGGTQVTVVEVLSTLTQKRKALTPSFDLRPARAFAWAKLGSLAGRTGTVPVQGRPTTPSDCFVHALAEKADEPMVWGTIAQATPVNGHTGIGPVSFTRLQCLAIALDLNPMDHETWKTAADCTAEAYATNDQANGWIALGDRRYSSKDCYDQAIRVMKGKAPKGARGEPGEWGAFRSLFIARVPSSVLVIAPSASAPTPPTASRPSPQGTLTAVGPSTTTNPAQLVPPPPPPPAAPKPAERTGLVDPALRGQLDGLLQQGESLASAGRLQEALACWDAVIAHDPTCLSAWKSKALALSELGDLNASLQCFDRAIQLAPQDGWTWMGKASVLRQAGRGPEAASCEANAKRLSPSLSRPPGTPTPEQLGDPSFNPSSSVSWFNYGNHLAQAGHAQYAIACFDEALKHDPNLGQAWNGKGVCLSKMGCKEEALGCYDWAVRINPTHARAWFNRGVILLELGRREEGLQAIAYAENLDPAMRSAPRPP
jgi:hypothetical protein